MANESVDARRRALTQDAFTGISKASRDLGLGERTLRQAVTSGELPSYVFHQRARLKVADVRRWIEQHRQRRP
jgi:excisionase family DNA binding protein